MDTPTINVRQLAHWDKLSDMYRVRLATLMYKIFFQITPPCMEFMIKRRASIHNSRYANRLTVPFSNSYYMNSNAYRGALIWNLLSPLASGRGIKAFTKKAKQSTKIRQLNFLAESPSEMSQMDPDFVYF